MQKIPTLFIRDERYPKFVSGVADEACQWVLDGEGDAFEKFDGTACAMFQGVYYARHKHEESRGQPPLDWVHWDWDPLILHGHGWLPVSESNPSHRWHLEALGDTLNADPIADGTYELLGPKVQSNPYQLQAHALVGHKSTVLTNRDSVPRHFPGLRDWLSGNYLEGMVWHHEDGRMAKIKRRDFGLPWPEKKRR